MKPLYDPTFFSGISSGSKTSALKLLSIYGRYAVVGSFVDVGCGAATWLEAAQQVFALPSNQLYGVDGAHARAAHDKKPFQFAYQDLQGSIRVREEKFDLLVCVEVAEHLPVERADTFVADLVLHSESVIFGAAIPNQGGTGHVNEQWPDYWAEKFAKHGYVQLDIFRSELWDAADVMGWYSQNTFLYVKEGSKFHDELRRRGAMDQPRLPTRVIHPTIFALAACETAGPRRLVRALPAAAKRAFRSILKLKR